MSSKVVIVTYGECQRNHAAKIGGYAVDGCREFMSSSEDQRSGAALTCAACGCHRNFHLKLGIIMGHGMGPILGQVSRGGTIDSASSSYSSTASNGK